MAQTNPYFYGYLPYNEFAFLRNDLYRETTSPATLNLLTGFTGYTLTTIGSDDHQYITSLTAPYHHWNIYLSYVYTHDTGFTMQYTLSGNTAVLPLLFVSGDGIPFRVSKTSTEYVLTSPVPHGISQGEYIVINSVPYYVNSVGNEIYNSEKYVLTLLQSQLGGTQLNGLINGKRCTDITDMNNTTSIYYVHKHKILTDQTDYILDKVGFESPIWDDERKLLYQNSADEDNYLVERNRMEAVLFDFKEPFILTGITNNLGYTQQNYMQQLYFEMVMDFSQGVLKSDI